MSEQEHKLVSDAIEVAVNVVDYLMDNKDVELKDDIQELTKAIASIIINNYNVVIEGNGKQTETNCFGCGNKKKTNSN